jgi:hypothetical protein
MMVKTPIRTLWTIVISCVSSRKVVVCLGKERWEPLHYNEVVDNVPADVSNQFNLIMQCLYAREDDALGQPLLREGQALRELL